ncbi:MAG: hypothetical protein WA851_20265 [Xanthobacteraceae bacterium]
MYQYTNEAAPRGILSTRKMWCCSHKQQQTDKTEFEYALVAAVDSVILRALHRYSVGKICAHADIGFRSGEGKRLVKARGLRSTFLWLAATPPEKTP